jgi:hypothetical protein
MREKRLENLEKSFCKIHASSLWLYITLSYIYIYITFSASPKKYGYVAGPKGEGD